MRPPESMRLLFKRFQKSSLHDLASDDSLLDLPFSSGPQCKGLRLVRYLEADDLQQAFRDFLQSTYEDEALARLTSIVPAPSYEVEALPGQPDMQLQLSIHL